MNRNSIYQYLQKDTDLRFSLAHIGKGKYPIFLVPFEWETSFLLIDDIRITDFQSVILFSNEIAVRFWVNDDAQVNIKYKDIDYFEVRENMNIGYIGLKDDKKLYY